jgi:hypothetical protein
MSLFFRFVMLSLACVRTIESFCDFETFNFDDVPIDDLVATRCLAKNVPCLVRNATFGWRANSEWTIRSLVLKYGNVAVDIDDEDIDTIGSFIQYMLGTEDEGNVGFTICSSHNSPTRMSILRHVTDPEYVFDEVLLSENGVLRSHYQVPAFFNDDMFDFLDDDIRPPFQWFLIGPRRSSTYYHIDPNNSRLFIIIIIIICIVLF